VVCFFSLVFSLLVIDWSFWTFLGIALLNESRGSIYPFPPPIFVCFLVFFLVDVFLGWSFFSGTSGPTPPVRGFMIDLDKSLTSSCTLCSRHKRSPLLFSSEPEVSTQFSPQLVLPFILFPPSLSPGYAYISSGRCVPFRQFILSYVR